MDLSRIYTKTSRGILDGALKTRVLGREHGRMLALIDGKSSLGDLLAKNTRLSQNRLAAIIDKLSEAGLIRLISEAPDADDLGFSATIIVSEANTQAFFDAQIAADLQLRRAEDEEALANEQARELLLKEVTADITAEAELLKRQEAERKARAAASTQAGHTNATNNGPAEPRPTQAKFTRAQLEAQAKADEAQANARAAKLKAEQEQHAAQVNARAEMERKAQAEAQRQTQLAAQALAAEERAELEQKKQLKVSLAQDRRELQAKIQAEEEAQKNADIDAHLLAIEQSGLATPTPAQTGLPKALDQSRIAVELESRVKRRLEARAREEANARARLAAEAQARMAEEARAKAEAEVQSRAAEEAQRQAEVEAKRLTEAAEAQAKLEAERKARLEAEQKAEADARAKAEAEVQAREEAQRQAEAEAKRLTEAAEAQAKLEAEQKARVEAEQKAHAEAEERAKVEAEAQARAAEEAQRQAEAEANRQAEAAAAQAKLEAERKARVEAEQKAQAEAEARAKTEAEVQVRAAEDAQRQAAAEAKRQAEAQAKLEAEQKARAEAEANALVAAAEEAVRQESAAAKRQMEEQQRKAEARRMTVAADLAMENAQQERLLAESTAQSLAEERAEIEAAALMREQEQALARDTANAKARSEMEEALQREQVALEQEEQEEKCLREEAEARALAAAQTAPPGFFAPSKRRSWQFSKTMKKQGLALLAILLVVGIALAHVLPFNFYIPKLESQLSASLGQPVRIQSVHFSAYPLPHLILEGVVVGNVQIANARLFPALTSWFSEVKLIHRVELETVTLTEESLKNLPLWSQRQASAVPYEFEQLQVLNAKLSHPLASAFTFEGVVDLRRGRFAQATIKSTDQRIHLHLVAQGETLLIDLSAKQSVLPFETQLPLESLKAKGVAQNGKLTLNNIEAQLFEGYASGNALMTWDKDWRYQADLNLVQIALAPALAHFTREPKLTGALEAKLRLSGQADKLTNLFDSSQAQATFRVKNGDLAGIDLVRSIQAPSRAGHSGGKTNFSDLTGYFQRSSGRTVIRQIKLQGGVVNASGQVDVAQDKSLSGALFAELQTQSTRFRASLVFAGDLATPILKLPPPRTLPAKTDAKVESLEPSAGEAGAIR